MRDLRYRGPSVSSCVQLRSWSLCFRFYYFPVLWKEEFQQGTVQDGSSLKLRRNLNIQENEKSVITNAYVPLTGLQMLVSCSPVFYLCACSLDVFIFKYIFSFMIKSVLFVLCGVLVERLRTETGVS